MIADAASLTLLEWERAVLASRSVEQLVGEAESYPGDSAHPAVATLLVADPTHELRHLLLGASTGKPVPGLSFVDSLMMRAPQLSVLVEPWVGRYNASDHGLLFPARGDLQHVALYPLLLRGRTLATLNLAAAGGMASVASEHAALRRHVAAVFGSTLERIVDRARLLRAGVSDSVAGWHSRYYFEARLREEIARCQREEIELSCALVDIDGLGIVNDRHGQLAGDCALREIAERLHSELRASDSAAHLGSDQFAMLLPNTSVANSTPLALRMLQAVQAETVLLPNAQECALTVSIGVAGLRPARNADRKSEADRIVARASVALHEAKLAGRNRYVLAAPD